MNNLDASIFYYYTAINICQYITKNVFSLTKIPIISSKAMEKKAKPRGEKETVYRYL